MYLFYENTIYSAYIQIYTQYMVLVKLFTLYYLQIAKLKTPDILSGVVSLLSDGWMTRGITNFVMTALIS